MAESKQAKKTTNPTTTPQEPTFTIEIEGGLSCVLKKPSRKIVGQALGMIMPMGPGDKPDPLTAGEWILKTCWVSGDKEILTDDDNLVPAALKCMELVKLKEATLKKN